MRQGCTQAQPAAWAMAPLNTMIKATMRIDASRTGSTLLSYGPSIFALQASQDASVVYQV